MSSISEFLFPRNSARRAWARDFAAGAFNFCLTRDLRSNHTSINPESSEELKKTLLENFYDDEAYLETPEGKRDLNDHLKVRLQNDRQYTVPWLNSAKSLSGAKILEIGCGTGASTVALAEQGAEIVAVDISEPSVAVAKKRCELHGLHNIDFRICNATDIAETMAGRDFDFIIFFASLEHMTLQERLTAMRTTWNMLKPGGLWSVIETPNRLWIHDAHTSFLPFFNWLPDDLAFQYSSFSPRPNFNDVYRDLTPDNMQAFLRRGRGASFHEFDLALDVAEKLDVVSSKKAFVNIRNPLIFLHDFFFGRAGFRKQLIRSKPNLDSGFFDENLDLIIRKTVR